VLGRNISTSETITPWLAHQAVACEALEGALLRECGGWPTPLSLTIPSTFEGTPLRTLAKLERLVDPAIASEKALAASRGRVYGVEGAAELLGEARRRRRPRLPSAVEVPVDRRLDTSRPVVHAGQAASNRRIL
jgi:hypothetical protein